uniref:FAD-binding FR-type domain-containing protein n=1 Tax=Physcomitrium patens TaxID=3218 RepID=A0A7I4EI93_PHYPA
MKGNLWNAGISVLDPPKYRVTFHHPLAPESKLATLPESLKTDIVARWVEHGRARAVVDSAGNPFGNARDHNSSSTGFGPPVMPIFAKMLVNSRITSEDHEQDVRHIELDLGSSGAQYVPGDILTLLPSQKLASVDKFLQRCGLDGDTFVTVEANDSDVCTIAQAEDVETVCKPTAVLLKTIVEALMDIDSASPRRYFFEVMSHFASAEHEKERLQYFATPEGRDDLYRYNQREGRTVLEVLEDFPSVQMPFEWLLQTVPRLQQRSFSISSSQLAHSNEAHLTVAVVEWTTPFKRKRRGLCSSWLASLDPKIGKVFLPVWFTKGAIALPSPSVPLILVGPGTGCAPFRAFIQERVALSNAEEAVAPVLFFFGCRMQAKDFLYESDWSAWSQGKNVLSPDVGGDFFVAFSRDQPEKVYVQHKIREQGKKVMQFIQSGAVIYVAGSANKMPADVMAAFETVLAKETGWPQEKATKYLRDLERRGQYVVEAWS